jgi:ribosomal protein S27AE
MTIREYVERRGLTIRYLATAWIAVILFAVFVFPERFALVTPWQAACYFIPIILLFVLIAATTKCPRCGADWAEMTWAVANPFSSERPDQCPNCGVSFGERMDGRTRIR